MTGSYAGNGIVSNDTTSVSLLNLEQLTFIGGSAAGAAAHDPDDLIMYDSTNGNLSYDADGNGGGAAQIFAVVSPGLAMSASNFLLVQGGVRSDKPTCSHGLVDRKLEARGPQGFNVGAVAPHCRRDLRCGRCDWRRTSCRSRASQGNARRDTRRRLPWRFPSRRSWW